jgi:hypothetical protein
MDDRKKWDKILQKHGLGLYRGHNSRKLTYGINHPLWESLRLSNVNRIRYEPPAAQPVKTHAHKCIVCCEGFVSRRRDAKICSARCRMRKLRK